MKHLTFIAKPLIPRGTTMSTTNGHRTRIISAHYVRAMARLRERQVQLLLDRGAVGVRVAGVTIPAWAHGVGVEKAGRMQWVVSLTEYRGH